MLESVNHDVFLCILAELQSCGSLVPFSQACRALRTASMPFLFGRIHRFLLGPFRDPAWFVPTHLASFVRYLTIEDQCPDQGAGDTKLTNMVWGHRRRVIFGFAPDPFLCGVIGGSILEQSLRGMPALRSVTICARRQVIHGLSWRAIKMILSIPQIREVSIIGLLLAPSKLPDDDYSLDSFSPITMFHYEVFSYRFDDMTTRENYPFPSELELLHLVLSRIHTSLERLVLSVEPAPLLAMSQWCWPNLRELRLRGERPSRPPVPYMTLLSAMPNLRTLALELTLVSEGCKCAEPVWPPGSRMSESLPLRDLSHLSVAHPDPADELYRHLPSTVRALSLCCRPHKSEKAWTSRRMIFAAHRYEYPIRRPAEILGILQSCQLPHLTRLEIEYQADEEELGLLRSLATMFPQLAWLQVHRYRDEDPASTPAVTYDNELDFVEAIGRALSNLSGLRTFCGYLDLPRQPMILYMGPPYYDSVHIAEYMKTLRRVAHTLAGTIPSLEIVYLWRPRKLGQIIWAPFEVVRGEDAPKGGVEIRCPVDVKNYGGPCYPVVPIPDSYNVDP